MNRLHALRFLCIVLAAGVGLDYASQAIVARVKDSSLLTLALSDKDLCLRAGADIGLKLCLGRSEAGQRLSLSASVCERHSGLCLAL